MNGLSYPHGSPRRGGMGRNEQREEEQRSWGLCVLALPPSLPVLLVLFVLHFFPTLHREALFPLTSLCLDLVVLSYLSPSLGRRRRLSDSSGLLRDRKADSVVFHLSEAASTL